MSGLEVLGEVDLGDQKSASSPSYSGLQVLGEEDLPSSTPPKYSPEDERRFSEAGRSMIPHPDFMQTESLLPKFIAGTPAPTAVSPEAKQFEKDVMASQRARVSPRAFFATAAEAATNPDVATVSTEPGSGANVERGIKEVETPGSRGTGALRLGAEAVNAATPLMGPAIPEAPASVLRGLITGYGASKGAGYLSKKAGASPDQQQLIEDISFWMPGVAESIFRPNVSAVSTPEGKGVTASVRGAGAGVVATPEEIRLGGRVGPFRGSISIPRNGPSAPAIEPPTIEGQVVPPDPAASALAQSQAQDAAARRAAKGVPPEPPAPSPNANVKLGAEDVQRIGELVAQLPEELRSQGMIEAHEKLAQVLLEKGKFVGPDGQLHIVENEKQASSLAQKIINDEIQRLDKASAEAAKTTPKGVTPKSEVAEGITSARARAKTPKLEILGETELPGVESARELPVSTESAKSPVSESESHPVTASRNSASGQRERNLAGESATPAAAVQGGERSQNASPANLTLLGEEHLFKKGDKVSLPGGDTGTVHYISDSIARVEVPKEGGGTKRVSIPPAKLKAASSSETPAESNVEKSAITDATKGDIVFARHGATKLDQEGGNETVAGWSQEPLDERGVKAAEQMAGNLKDSGVTKIVSSDLARAKQTAEIVGKELGIPVETDERLRPQRIPEIEGKKVKDIQNVRDDLKQNPDKVPQGGESYNQARARQDEVLSEVEKSVKQGEKPLVVTHSTNLEAELGEKPEPGGIIGKNLKPEGGSSEPAKGERRHDISTRKKVSEMSHEEMQKELLSSKLTGLPNRRAFEESEPSKAVAMSDADGLKAFNDKFGYEAGNTLLQAKADALKKAALDAYHDKGDEFLYRGESPEELHGKLEKAREILRNTEFLVTKNDGSQLRVKGVDFSHGAGKDLTAAESKLKSHKSEREARGERARGELRGITQTPEGVHKESGKAELEEPKKFKHRSTQINIPENSEASEAISAARERIADSDFAGKGKDIGGNHVTVRWGLKAPDDADLSKMKQYLSSLQPFEATLGKTEKFEPSESSEGAAVIQAPIEAPELTKINSELGNHAEFTEPTFKYSPHATVAYVKPDKADRYVGMSVTQGKKFKVDSIAITDREGKQEEVKLEGKSHLGRLIVKSLETGRTNIIPENPLGPASETQAVSGLVDAIYNKLKSGESLGNVTALTKLAEEHFGSSRVSGNWTPKDMFDAMEAGVNKYLLERGKELLEMPAEKALAELKNLESRITSQGTRTEEQIKAQQFSTPPRESFLVAKVADLKPSDVVLEPSAGNGGLAVWPAAIGAEVHVNEIAERRQKMLEAAGLPKPTTHDGELINALLDESVKPTVILMNPPFSSGILKSNQGKNRNLFGFNHVEQALQRLETNGRLVAILGGGQANEPEGGASLTGGSSGAWFNKIARQYHIRANVRVNGKEYQKYGTNFATRIIVIDKDGPTTPDQWLSIVRKNVDTLEEAYNALARVAASRPQLGGNDVTARSEGAVPAARSAGTAGAREIETGAGGRAPENTRASGNGARSGESATPSGSLQPADRLHGSERGAGLVRPEQAGERVSLDESRNQPAGPPEAKSAENLRSSAENANQERPLQQPEVEGLVLGREQQSLEEQEDSSSYVNYRPTIKAGAHPGSIVESKAMATVPLPEISYRPSLPDSVIKEGKLSAVQLEAISIAGQQNDILLPSGHRASALIGDGTGVGKGRIAAGILWDNFNKGRKRLVWVSEKWDLMEDAKRDFNGIGATELAKNIKAFQKYDVKTPIDHNGVLFTTYALIRSGDSKGNTRVAQLERWLRGDDQAEGAYILFDESHNLKNAVVGEMGQPSEIGKTVKALLERNPRLRTASESATAATDVMNLGYLDRLGLWGPGTSFPNGFNEFAAQISSGGISAMEMVARELKAQGKYLSRTLSYKGVTYNELEHKLTREQKELYRTATKAWAAVVQDAEKTIEQTTGGGHRQVARFMALFYGAQLRFFNVLLSTLKIPTVVEDTNKALADGKSVVITLVNTNEAAQNREKNKERPQAIDEDEPPDYDFGPAEMLSELVREHYPTQQYKDDLDSEGRLIKVPVVDEDGNPVHNPEAIRRQKQLLEDIKRDLKLPANPLDILIDSFGGTSKVAELTGRKERYDTALGKFIKRGDAGVKRDEVNLSEMRNFQSGKKRIAILSNAAGTGISLHAGNDVANKQKRHHITLQMGWSADKAMQMLGRTHRANQVQPPEYFTVVSDLGGEKRFSATIAKRLGSLGALSKGQKSAITSSDAMEKVNFESDQGRKAANTFYERLLRNSEIPGTDLRGMTVLRDLRVLKKDPQTQSETVPKADRTNVTRLLNRLLALDPDVQNAVYDYYYDIFQATVEQAIENGDLDTGVKALPGDKFSIKEERSIAREPKTDAETFYYPIESQVKTERTPVSRIETALKRYEKQDGRILRNDKGKLFFVRKAPAIVRADGHTEDASYVVSPDNGVQRKVEDWKLRDYREIAESQTDGALKDWQSQYDASPDHLTQEHHLIGGAVLRWWNQIKDAADERLHIFTATDSKTGKRVVGVEVAPGAINKLLDRITGSKSTVSGGQLATDVLKNNLTFTLEQNIQVRKGRIGAKPVIQLIPPSSNIAENLKRLGVIYERGMTPIYYIPTTETYGGRFEAKQDVIDKLLEQYPVKQDESVGELLHSESGSFNPSAMRPSAVRSRYQELANEAIGKLGLTKYFDLEKVDPQIADTLHLVDNAPRYFREKARANLDQVTSGLSDEQMRLASLMVDSDSRDYIEEHKPEDYEKALNDPEVMAAVSKFGPLQKELADDRIALGWPIRRSMSIEPNEAGEFDVLDRDGNYVDTFESERDARDFVEQEANIEPHLKRTYPEHTRNPLPAETASGPYTGTFNRDKGLRPPKMDKKAREMSAEYFYQHGSKDFSGYLESFAKVKEALLKQKLFDDLRDKATEWKAGTAQPPEIEYEGKTYYRPDIAMQMRRAESEKARPVIPGIPGKPQKDIPEYGIYDPSRGERFLIRTPEYATLSTGKPGIGPNDRLLAPKIIVDTLEKYDASRGGDGPGSLRRFFQEQIVGLFGPTVHAFNIIRRVGQATGQGVFDPRSWNDIAKVITSSELRNRVMKGVNDDTVDLLTKYGDYTDWRDIGNLNAYVGGNLNVFNWVRHFGKGVLFDPRFAGGWGGLDPKARVIVADYFKEHYPEMTERQIADAVNDGFGNYNRANWTERQRKIARFSLFPGWDFGSFKWFIRHPWVTAIVPAVVTLAINLALHALGKNKGDDEYDFGYIHWGDRKLRTGLFTEGMAHALTEPIWSAGEAYLKHEDVGAAATEGLVKGASTMAGTLAGPTVEMLANQLANRKYAGGESEIVNPEDKYTPGTWAPNVELEKRIAYTYLKGLPAANRFVDSKGRFDWMQGMGSIFGITNYRFGAEERLKQNEAKARDYSKVLSTLAERDPEAAKDFVANSTKAAYLMFNGDLSQMTKDLKEIDKEKERVSSAAGISTEQKKQSLENLDRARKQLLRAADAVNDLLIQVKLGRPKTMAAAQ